MKINKQYRQDLKTVMEASKNWRNISRDKREEMNVIFNTIIFYTCLAFLLLFLAFNANATEFHSSSNPIVNHEIIKQIESSGNPNAYNKHSKATGLYQITPICLKDYIIYHPSSQLTMQDMFDHENNKKVALWYIYKRIPQLLRYYGHDYTLENVLIAYNCGIGCIDSPLPQETINYITKYNKFINQ